MIVWTDLETTGLDPHREGSLVLEAAVVITNDNLDEVYHTARTVHADPQRLFIDGVIDEYILEMHTDNGLWEECRSSMLPPHGLDAALCQWYDGINLDDEKFPLGGSTISFDRNWMGRHLPNFMDRLHYRNIDVSTVKELNKRWAPAIHEHYEATKSEIKAHRGLADVRESLREARLYRDMLWGSFHDG